MAETIQDFLVSVKYAVDDASRNRFLETLKRVGGSVAGVATQIASLTGALFLLSKKLAEAGDNFYFMSNRLGMSVNDIKSATYAMEQFGISAEEAAGNLERFGDWQRKNGGASTAYLRSLGVTARDTAGQLDQLATLAMKMGGTLENALGNDAQRNRFAIARATFESIGMNEQAMLALSDPNRQRNKERAGLIARTVWGAETDEEAKRKSDRWKDDANKIMTQFREMGLIFDTIRMKFGQALFEKVLPHLLKFNEMMLKHMPAITKVVDVAAKSIEIFIRLVSTATETLLKLPGALQIAIAAFTAWPMAMMLMRSPLAWILAGLTALLGIMNDFQVYQRGGTSLFDWGWVDKLGDKFKWMETLAEPFIKMGEEMARWFDCVTGIEGSFLAISATIALILGRIGAAKAAGLIGEFLGVGGKAAAGRAAAGGIAGGLLAPILTLAAATIIVTKGFLTIEEWLTKQGIVDPNAFKSQEPGQGGTKTEWWWPLPGPGKRDEPPEWVKRLGRWVTGDVRESGNRAFAGPGAAGGPSIQQNTPAGQFLANYVMGGGAAAAGGSGGGGGGGGAADADAGGGADTSNMAFSTSQWDAFRQRLGQRESGGKYNITGGSSGRFSGKYQFGAAEIAETAKQLGEAVPSRQQFLNDPAMQERYLQQYTLMHHRQLMRNPKYAAMNAADRAGALMAAHLLGVGGANKVLAGDTRSADAFGTTGAKYFAEGRDAVAGAPLGSTPMPGQQTAAAQNTQGGGFGQAIQNNHTSVTVAPGPNAEATARAVGEEQMRLHERQVRAFQGAVY